MAPGSEPPDLNDGEGPQKRQRGRPKGSKNGPNAGAVGRPRNDGGAPKKRKLANGSTLPLNVSGRSSRAADGPSSSEAGDAFRSLSEETPAAPAAQAVAATGSGHCAHCGSTAEFSAGNSRETSDLPPLSPQEVPEGVGVLLSTNASLGGIANQVGTPVAGGVIAEDLDVPMDAPAAVNNVAEGTPVHKHLQNLWAPSPGIGLKNEFDDLYEAEDNDDDLDNIFADSDSIPEDVDEFLPVGDDDESDLLSNSSSPSPVHHGASRPLPIHHKEYASIPTWLPKHYGDTRERLVLEMKKNPSHLPTCYVRNTFYDGRKNHFFVANTKARLPPEVFYEPLYFIWLPHLIIGRIPCPECLSKSRKDPKGNQIYLSPNGWPKMPRRVFDLFRCVYIIGQRYLCRHPDCKKTYQSWSPSILAALPTPLALQFTFHLTHRSGLTDALVSFMRLCFLQGIGPTPFSNIIRVNHIRQYEQLAHQYYEMQVIRQKSPLLSAARPEPFSSFHDRDGYAGATPSGHYLRNFYVIYMSAHAPAMDQYTSLLPGRVMQFDHSFKVPKHLGKLNGVPVFTALHSGVNEFCEIRSLVMTPTKAHNQFMPAIRALYDSLLLYGHDPTEAVFTDNPRADAPELETAIPSLRTDVVPVPNLTNLKHLKLPENTDILKLSSEFQVRTRFDSILNSLANNEDSYAAVDMEWSVDTTSGLQSKVALISVTFGQEIFLTLRALAYIINVNTVFKFQISSPHNLQ